MSQDLWLAALVGAARARPHQPFLFWRQGIDWRWRSFGRLADHLALAAWSFKPFPERREIGYEHRAHPDALSVGLAIQASGRDALTTLRDGVPIAYLDDPHRFAVPRPPHIALPVCRSEIAATPSTELVIETQGGLEVEGRRFSAEEIQNRGNALAKLLPTRSERLIVHAGASLGPLLDHVVLAACLRRSAALALEPDAPAVAASIQFARPHIVIASPAELETLRSALSPKSRHSRLFRWIAATADRLEAVDV